MPILLEVFGVAGGPLLVLLLLYLFFRRRRNNRAAEIDIRSLSDEDYESRGILWRRFYCRICSQEWRVSSHWDASASVILIRCPKCGEGASLDRIQQSYRSRQLRINTDKEKAEERVREEEAKLSEAVREGGRVVNLDK